MKNRLSQLCDCPPAMQESGNRKQLIYSETVAVVVGILCILFLRKAIFKELYLQGIDVSESLHQNITAFLLQTLVALLALFSVVSVLIQWIAAAWSGTKVGTLSISSGCAFAGDHPDFSVEQLTKAADLSMYAQKQEYYRAKKLSSGTPVPSGNGERS